LRPAAYTLSAWVRADGPGANNDSYGSVVIQQIATSGAATAGGIWWDALSGRFKSFTGSVSTDPPAISATQFPAGTLHHVAVTYEARALALYVDGALEASVTLNADAVHDGQPWTIGGSRDAFRAQGYPRTWNGLIDDVRIIGRALSEAEIGDLAAARPDGMCGGSCAAPAAVGSTVTWNPLTAGTSIVLSNGDQRQL
ncbi:MAG: LamG domain-containing protein, partial [Vicinamibacterales bacterium]|nr:LamG domain-containing protein [Vicinamibacterales bacterium]